ncbi:GNAT family N-acetyltransferase [uncultured Nocardioides sp.]|uniref:GNAT family N-acetyltransferase n=1 Tax=uncultured Nocardioides sp. TaxID=198441 RepID=UPI000C550A5D|nr:GNAT family protein [uncultured Nocardioides sp.]MAO79226.1 GNAT family N-acetyltransferase [Nocardioides sp.]
MNDSEASARDTRLPTPWPTRVGDLLLREPGAGDLDAVLAFRNDADVNRFMVRTHVDATELRREWAAIPQSDTDWSCVAERGGEVVAVGFLDVVDGSGQPGHPTGTDGVIGYIVRPGMAGQGIASATATALLRAAFEVLGLRRVTARANADNHASVRVLEKAGMRRERYAVEALWHQELGWLDEVEYALLAHEWPQASGARSL